MRDPASKPSTDASVGTWGGWVDWADVMPIFGSHVKRLGLVRAVVGGAPMYLSLPLFLAFHVTGIPFFQLVLSPILQLPKTPLRRFLVVDRHRIKGLSLLDRFNCAFCGYANGICQFLNARLDQVHERSPALGSLRQYLVLVLSLPLLPLLSLVQLLGVRFLYDLVISRPLGMKRTSVGEVRDGLRSSNYGDGLAALPRMVLRAEKNFALRLAATLEQIESAWCPLRHLCDRADCVFPAHHERFFAPGELERMKRVLQTEGTVSTRR